MDTNLPSTTSNKLITLIKSLDSDMLERVNIFIAGIEAGKSLAPKKKISVHTKKTAPQVAENNFPKQK